MRLVLAQVLIASNLCAHPRAATDSQGVSLIHISSASTGRKRIRADPGGRRTWHIDGTARAIRTAPRSSDAVARARRARCVELATGFEPATLSLGSRRRFPVGSPISASSAGRGGPQLGVKAAASHWLRHAARWSLPGFRYPPSTPSRPPRPAGSRRRAARHAPGASSPARSCVRCA